MVHVNKTKAIAIDFLKIFVLVKKTNKDWWQIRCANPCALLGVLIKPLLL